MTRPIYCFFPAANTTYYASSQPLNIASSGNSNLNLNVQPTAPFSQNNFYRTITLTANASLVGLTAFTITGNTINGVQSETIAGFATTATSVNQYIGTPTISYTNLPLLSPTINVSAGTGSTGITPWINLNYYSKMSQVSVQAVVTGTITYSVNQTLDNVIHPNNPYLEQVPTPAAFAVSTALTNATTNQIGTLIQPVTGVQLVVSASTGGSLRFTVLQQGVN